MKVLGRVVAGLALGLAVTGAHAQQVVGLATTKGGATAQIATALAKVISEQTDLQVRPQVMANTSQYLPVVNSSRIEFGVANFPQTYYAVTGKGMSEGHPEPNLRLVANLFPFATGFVATVKSGMKTCADLKGKRVPRFPDKSLGDYNMRACLSSGGLTYKDVTSVPVANFPREFAAFKQGDIDISIAAVGSQNVIDFQASLGAVHYLSFNKERESAVKKLLPGSALRHVPVTKGNVGVTAETYVLVFDYALFTNKSVSDKVVGKVVQALIKGAKDLKASSPLWAEYDPKKLYDPTTSGPDAALKYHPGAVAAYKAAGF